MADDTVKFGLAGRVTASHCTAMGSYEPYYSSKLRGFLKRAGINIVVNPYRQLADPGPARHVSEAARLRAAEGAARRGRQRLARQRRDHGSWYSLGKADLVDAAHLALHFTYMSGRDEIVEMLRCATERGARTLGVEDEYGIEEGKPADCVVFDAPDARRGDPAARDAPLGDPPRPRRRRDDTGPFDSARRAGYVCTAMIQSPDDRREQWP